MKTFVVKIVCQRLLAKDKKPPLAVAVITLHNTVITVTPSIAAKARRMNTFRALEVKIIAAANTWTINNEINHFSFETRVHGVALYETCILLKMMWNDFTSYHHYAGLSFYY